MTKRKRTIIAASLGLLFLIIAPLAVFYSLGWRFDWERKEITRPGILFLRTKPASVEILINGKLKDKTDFFFGSSTIGNLLPGEYQVKAVKENYHDWEKKLEIKEGQVTEVKNIVLIPRKPEFKRISQEISSFYFSRNMKEIVLAEEDSSLKIYDLEREVKGLLAEKEDFSKGDIHLVDVKFSPGGSDLLVKTFIDEGFSYFLLKKNASPAEIRSLDFLQNPERVYFHPQDPEKLFVLKGGTLKEADLQEKDLSESLSENIIAVCFENNSSYYLKEEGYVFQNDLSFQKESKLIQNPISVKNETEYGIEGSESYLILKEANALYTLKDKNLKKISDHVSEFKVSEDRKKLTYFNGFEIWVYFLESTNEFPPKKEGDNIFITRLSENIRDVFWYTNHYLVFSSQENIKVAEIDERDKINIAVLADFKDPDMFWNKEDKRLYVLAENNLFQSKNLIP